MKLRCIQNVVQVELPPMEQTEGGIVIPECYKNENKFCEGTIVAIGPGLKSPKTGELVPVDLKIGDKVMIQPHRFLTWDDEGVKYAFCREPDIMAEEDEFFGLEMRKCYPKEGDLTAPKDL